MKSRLTLNNLIAGLQTFFICMTLYAGEKGIMGYAGEKYDTERTSREVTFDR